MDHTVPKTIEARVAALEIQVIYVISLHLHYVAFGGYYLYRPQLRWL